MIRLEQVSPEQRELLWNIHQKYLYEMTNYYADEMDENGNYSYGYFDAYFTEPERTALLIRDDTRLAGFAMLNPYSYIGGKPDHVLAEFTVFPQYRRKHLGKDAAECILRSYSGRWEIKYHEQNAAAKALWNQVTQPYHPQRHHYSNNETVLSFSTAQQIFHA